MRSKKAIMNIFMKLLLQVIVVLYGFIVPKIIIGHFGSNVNGLISSITQFLAYITLLEAGFGPVVKSVLYKPIAKKDNKTIAEILKSSECFFRKIAYIFLIYIAILCFLYPTLVSQDFGWIYTISLIIIIGISTFAEYFFGMTYKLFLQADQKNYIISLIQIVTYVLSIIVIIIMIQFGANIHIIKLLSGIIFLFRPLVQNLYVKKKYNIDFKSENGKYEIKQKWDGLAQHVASVIHENTDVTLLTIFSNLINISIYSVYVLITKGVRSIVFGFAEGIDSSFGDMIAKNETENLRKRFGMYETVYLLLSTTVFSSTLLLIVPFIAVYTKNITDANYINYLFGYLIVLSEFIFVIRMPFSTLTKAAGHFKETRVGAWVECISNIVISIILVKRYGLVGVAIGTIVAMSIRTIEFVYHTNKYILERSTFESIKKFLLVIVETLIIVFICRYLPYVDNVSYINWIINALMVFAVSIFVVLILNYIFFRKELKEAAKIFKRVFNKKSKSN